VAGYDVGRGLGRGLFALQGASRKKKELFDIYNSSSEINNVQDVSYLQVNSKDVSEKHELSIFQFSSISTN
jgi:hypothetical protein